jgi:hypothetical protein
MEAYEIDAPRAHPLRSGPGTPYSLCSSSIPLVEGSDRWRQSETGERSICSSSDLEKDEDERERERIIFS